MIACKATFVLLLALSSSAAEQPTLRGPSAFGWSFDDANSDEFTGGLSKWKQQLGDWIGSPPAAFVDSNAVVKSSILTLSTVDQPGFTPPDEPDTGSCDCGFKDMTSGMVVSSSKMQFGFFEIEAKFAKASLLNSFWLQGASSEINALEVVPTSKADEGQQKVRSDVHCFVQGGDPTKVESSPAPLNLPENFDATIYHKYGIDWSEDSVVYYVDGAVARTLQRSSLKTDGCLNEPMNVILSVETLESEGLPDFSGSTNKYDTQITYFRHWKRTAKPTVKPTTVKPTTVMPTTVMPTTVKPTTVKPTTVKPTTLKPTTVKPTMVTTAIPSTASPGTATSAETCATLRFAFRYNNKNVCGHSSTKLGPGGSSNMCHNKAAFATSNQICTTAGARLCTADELRADATRGTGCGHDNRRVWTSDGCSTNDGVAGFLAVRGRSGKRTGTEDVCLVASDATPAVRCCGDRVIDTVTQLTTSKPEEPTSTEPVGGAPTSSYACAKLKFIFSQKSKNKDVCAHSSLRFGPGGNSNTCHNKVAFATSKQICDTAGARLCTADELRADVAMWTGCGHDNRRVWTSDGCSTNDGVAGFLAVRGRSGKRTGTEDVCLVASDATPAVRCCGDRVVAGSSNKRLGSVGMMTEDAAPEVEFGGSVHLKLGALVAGQSVAVGEDQVPYESEGGTQSNDVFVAEVALMDYYGEEGSSSSDSGGGSGSGPAGAASAAGVAMLAGVVLVVALAVRARKQRQEQLEPDSAMVESGRRRSSGSSEFQAVATHVELEAAATATASSVATKAVVKPADSSDKEQQEIFKEQEYMYSAPAPPPPSNEAAESTNQDLDELALRMKSVRRCNPAYVQSIIGSQL